MKGEIWKDIEGYEGLYQVSNMGRVKSVERTIWNSGKGCYRTVHERILKPSKTNDGYLQVQLHQDGKKKWYRIHRLVATAFCENPYGYTDVNHIDEDKTNNCANNLEWCSRSYNNNYGTRNKRIAEKLTNNPKISKPVLAIDKRTGLIIEFVSSIEAERETGIDHSNIIKCCQGKYKTSGGFYWYYANANDDAEQ